MVDKIQKLKQVDYLKHLQDVRLVGLIVFGVIALIVTWSGIGAVESNYKLQNQISQLQQQNLLQSLQNNNLQLQDEYYNTNEYLELQSRALFGKGLPGEKLIIVPENVALATLAPLPKDQTTLTASSPPKPLYQRNFESWMNFFFHRGS